MFWKYFRGVNYCFGTQNFNLTRKFIRNNNTIMKNCRIDRAVKSRFPQNVLMTISEEFVPVESIESLFTSNSHENF